MEIRPIRTDSDLDAAFARFETLWGSEAGTPDGDEFDVLATLIEAYERKHHALPPGDPIEVITFKMEELGLSGRELARQLGWGSGRVSEVLNRKRALTLSMIQQLAKALEIPAGLLVGQEGEEAASEGWVWLRPQVLQRIQAAIGGEGNDGVADWIERVAIEALESNAAAYATDSASTPNISLRARR